MIFLSKKLQRFIANTLSKRVLKKDSDMLRKRKKVPILNTWIYSPLLIWIILCSCLKSKMLLFFRALYCYIKILLLTRKLTKKNYVMPDMFHDLVKKHPNKACFLFEEETWTFQQVFYLLITPRLSFSLDQTTTVIMTDVTMLKHENNVIKSTSSDNHFTEEKCIIITSR